MLTDKDKFRPWRADYLVFGAPDIGEAEIEEVSACMRSNWLGTGPRVQRFETALANYLKAPHSVALGSCSAALHLALRDLGLPRKSEIIVPALTFCATANAVVHAGHKPVFCDVDPVSMNLDPADARRRVTKKTRAVVPVHFAGRPCDMGAVLTLAKERSLRVIEDCAHALEASVGDRHCGTFGDFGCFSFYVTKNITSVEGGLLVCREEETARRIRQAALHGMSGDAWKRFSDDGFKHYEVADPGFKYNMTDLEASIGLRQLERLARMRKRRESLWRFYLRELEELPLILPAAVPEGNVHGMHLFTCRIDESRTRLTRDQAVDALHALKIGCGIHYRPLHLHSYYRRRLRHRPGDLPHAERIGERIFSIPFSSAVGEEDARDVVRALRTVFDP